MTEAISVSDCPADIVARLRTHYDVVDLVDGRGLQSSDGQPGVVLSAFIATVELSVTAPVALPLCPNDPYIRRLTAGQQRLTERLILFNILEQRRKRASSCCRPRRRCGCCCCCWAVMTRRQRPKG